MPLARNPALRLVVLPQEDVGFFLRPWQCGERKGGRGGSGCGAITSALTRGTGLTQLQGGSGDLIGPWTQEEEERTGLDTCVTGRGGNCSQYIQSPTILVPSP